MFELSFEVSCPTKANKEQVWHFWSEVKLWKEWDKGLELVTLEGPFLPKSAGTLRPVGGPTFGFVLVEVEVFKKFIDRTFLPLTHLDFTHTYTANPSGQGGVIAHRVSFAGWLAPFFRFVIGNDIQKTLPETLARLSALAETL